MVNDTDIEALAAKIEEHDADPSDLALVERKEHEELTAEKKELSEKVSTLESEKEDLQKKYEEDVEPLAEMLSEILSEHIKLDAESLKEKFSVSEMKEHLEELEVELKEELSTDEPDIKSGDPDKDELQGTPDDEVDEEELEILKEKKSTYEEMGWTVMAEEVQDELDELTAE